VIGSEPGLQLRLLGGFALIRDGAAAGQVSLRRAQAMLAFLASKVSRTETREVLLDMLWPDRFKEQAQASLRQVLFELRAIPVVGPSLVETSRTGVALGPAIVDCDVWHLERLAKMNDLDSAESVLDLYRGPLLDGASVGSEPFGQWLSVQASHLEARVEGAVLRATAEPLGPADYERAIRALSRLIELSPMSCQAMSRLMQIEVGRGRIQEARQQYERYTRRLQIEFDEQPPPELHQAYLALKSDPRPSGVASPVLRRPAYVHHDPWTRTQSDAPVVAVLPFRYEGALAAGAALATALSDDITLTLSGCRWFSVLSRAAANSLKGGALFVPKDFAQLTGADYLIYGTITDRADGLSLVIELAEAETGYIRWAKRYDAPGPNALAWASELCPEIVAALDPAVAESERMALRRPALAATGSEVAYQHLVRGYRQFYAGQWAEALASFRSAIGEDATYAHAHAMTAVTTYLSAQVQKGTGWVTALREAEACARRALEIDPSEAKACNVLGQALDWQARHEEANDFLKRAVTLNPSFALASTARSYHAVMTGEFDNAKVFIRTAMRLRVGDAGMGLCLPSKALADMHLGNHQEALQTAHWAVRLQPKFWLGRQVLAACLSVCDQQAQAVQATAELKLDYAGLSSDDFAAWFPYADPDDRKPVAEALRRAGWQ
jgi:DNA-binding SARP family transcriptional activator/TolB-like protein/Tfp pilus assembly protein PilF